MALNTNKDLKKYYSIQEVAKMYDVNESLLRYWETEFPQLKPRRAGRDIRSARIRTAPIAATRPLRCYKLSVHSS